MDATFLARVKGDFPHLRFVAGRRFSFRPPRTVVYVERRFDDASDSGNFKSSRLGDDADSLLFLHEVGHALTGKFEFKTEVERLKIEVLAWEKAKELCAKYDIEVDEDLIEGELDSYRDWLHQKSRCPRCGLTRFQTPDGAWCCPRCAIV